MESARGDGTDPTIATRENDGGRFAHPRAQAVSESVLNPPCVTTPNPIAAGLTNGAFIVCPPQRLGESLHYTKTSSGDSSLLGSWDRNVVQRVSDGNNFFVVNEIDDQPHDSLCPRAALPGVIVAVVQIVKPVGDCQGFISAAIFVPPSSLQSEGSTRPLYSSTLFNGTDVKSALLATILYVCGGQNRSRHSGPVCRCKRHEGIVEPRV